MVNYQYREECKDDPHYPRYVVIVVQYCRQISSQKVLNFAKNYQNSFYENEKDKKIGIKGFKFRLATSEDMEKISGYYFNAVTPFFMKDESHPVLVDRHIAELQPSYFWLGGGRVSLKLGISVPDFKSYLGPRYQAADISL